MDARYRTVRKDDLETYQNVSHVLPVEEVTDTEPSMSFLVSQWKLVGCIRIEFRGIESLIIDVVDTLIHALDTFLFILLSLEAAQELARDWCRHGG
jgi:hypothetical protein